MRAYVFIDGNNFYFKLRSLTERLGRKYRLSTFNFRVFSEWLAQPNTPTEISYYIGAVKQQQNNEKGRKMFADQQRLFMKLRAQNISLILGQLIRHPDKTYHEKGVDVRIAVELLVGAYENFYDAAILVSSDTDLLPAMAKVRELGKKIEYVGFGHRPSFAMQANANVSRLIVVSDVKKFLKK